MFDSQASELAAQITKVLVPFLPYLVEGIKLAGKKGAEQLGEESAKALWDKLKGKQNVRTVAKAVAKLPDNQAIQKGLQEEIRKALHSDPSLAFELRQLLGEQADSRGGRSVQQTAFDIEGNVIQVGGDFIQVRGSEKSGEG